MTPSSPVLACALCAEVLTALVGLGGWAVWLVTLVLRGIPRRGRCNCPCKECHDGAAHEHRH